ncbi:unnamed protein product [Toxocara canis]|uniref:Uncharacterized protein n=1 Tax=Toxocara canis TaxID=6265 RepID=A0A183V0E3_TOXCA|nr:unnamed protein product [Toxocara canis]
MEVKREFGESVKWRGKAAKRSAGRVVSVATTRRHPLLSMLPVIQCSWAKLLASKPLQLAAASYTTSNGAILSNNSTPQPFRNAPYLQNRMP